MSLASRPDSSCDRNSPSRRPAMTARSRSSRLSAVSIHPRNWITIGMEGFWSTCCGSCCRINRVELRILSFELKPKLVTRNQELETDRNETTKSADDDGQNIAGDSGRNSSIYHFELARR